MKKCLAILSIIMYMAVTSGLVLQIHYCMGAAAGSSLQLTATDSHACSKCGMQKAKNRCCHDEVTFLKLQDAHKQVSAGFDVHTPVCAVVPAASGYDLPGIAADRPIFAWSHAPPDDSGQPPLFLRHGNFRV